MISRFTESVVEQASLDWLQELGWTICAGPEIAPGEPATQFEAASQIFVESALDICIIFDTLPLMPRDAKQPILNVVFYQTAAGSEPVRELLKELDSQDRKRIGVDIKTAQFGWPVGMPLIRKLEPGLWEVRSQIRQGIARVIFTVEDDTMVLLHGFIKKSQRTPRTELDTARRRLANLNRE